MTIWKAVLVAAEIQTRELPEGAEILCAREQGDDICIWFRCNPLKPSKDRTIGIFPTGGNAPDGDGWRYLGTAMLAGGSLVFHVFERTQ